jgi:hypothetical protein
MKFREVFAFDNERALDSFIGSDWQFGRQSTAALKTENKGGSMAGAAAVSDGVWMYQNGPSRIEKKWCFRQCRGWEDSSRPSGRPVLVGHPIN